MAQTKKATTTAESAKGVETAIVEAAPSEEITSYKGFTADLKCRDFQFAIGQTYEAIGDIEACSNGYHACDNPFDVWSYYGPIDADGRLSRYAIVKQSGDLSRHNADSKIASRLLTVIVEISLGQFVTKAVNVIEAASKPLNDNGGYGARIGSSGYRAQIGSSGCHAQIGSSGDHAQIGSNGYGAQIGSSGDAARIGSSGNHAQIGSSGDGAQIGSSGYRARIGSSGNGAQIGSSGDGAQIGSSGYSARIGSSGYRARIGSSGNHAQINAGGEHSIIASAGRNVTVTGAQGTWISLAEFDDGDMCIGFAVGCIGMDGLEPHKPYRARGGKLVPA